MRKTIWHPSASAFAALVTLAIPAILAACANDATRPLEPMIPKAMADQQPDLGTCGTLAPAAGSTLVYHVYANGVQIYRWTGTSWLLYGPDAVLSSDAGGKSIVGTHYVGPTWETNSGGKVVGAVINRCTADPNAVQWLSLSAQSTGPGVLNSVTFIQRVNTVGGKAPSTGGAVIGDEISVQYAAEYFFYK